MTESERLASDPNQEFSMLDEILRKTQRYSELLLEELPTKSTAGEAALTEEEKWEKEQARLFPSMTDGQMHPYLIKGANWLISLWQNGLNGILEAQMGFGAVIQTLGFLAHLKRNGLHGPYMIVSSQHGDAIPEWLSGIRFDFSDKEGQDQRTEEERKAHLSKLHAILHPFLLRQVEEDVENKVPQKKSAACHKTEVVQHPTAIHITCSKNHATKEVTRTSSWSCQAVAAKVPQKKGATCSDAISVTSSKDHAATEGARTAAESCQEGAAEVVSETGGEGSPNMRSSQLGLEGNEVVKRRRTNDSLITPLEESNPAAHVQVPKSTSSELIFKALNEIPDIARTDILRAYSSLIRDDRQFESLMALPVDMRKDWLLMEIGNK